MTEEKKFISKIRLTSGEQYHFKDEEAREMIDVFLQDFTLNCGTATTVITEEDITILDCGTATTGI
jgi:hypothetical protein